MLNSPTNNPIFDPAVNGYMNATLTPNVVVGLICQGQRYFFTYANANTTITPAPEELTASTVFEIGSITKAFTATMLSYKVGYGYMSLLDPVTKYLPYTFAQNAGLNNVTIGQLATHTSGMPDQGAAKPAKELFGGKQPSTDLIAWWQGFNTPSPPPPAATSCWLYSNIAFVTLGFAVGRCDPNNYNGLLSTYITDELNMTQTASQNPPGLTVAQGYIGNATTNQPVTTQADDLKSTALDMTIFLDACIRP